jgi:hypothetical protein
VVFLPQLHNTPHTGPHEAFHQGYRTMVEKGTIKKETVSGQKSDKKIKKIKQSLLA